MKVHLPDDWIKNPKTEETMEVIAEAAIPVNPVKGVIGVALIIGGVGLLVSSAFYEGCKAYNQAEFNVLDTLGLFK